MTRRYQQDVALSRLLALQTPQKTYHDYVTAILTQLGDAFDTLTLASVLAADLAAALT